MKKMKRALLLFVLVTSMIFESVTVFASEISINDGIIKNDGNESVNQSLDSKAVFVQNAQMQVIAQGYSLEKYHVINVLGDSITEGVGARNKENVYPTVLARLTGAKVNNYGLSCSRITDVHNQYTVASFIDRMYNMDPNADLIIVFGGTNDFWYGDCPIGNPEDNRVDTFYGAMNTLCRHLKNTYPTADIMFVTPYQQGKDADETHGYKRSTYGNFGTGTLMQYRMAILNRCEYYNIPVLDLYSDYELNTADNREALEKYGNYLCDGCHLNDAGYCVLAAKMYQFFMRDLNGYASSMFFFDSNPQAVAK